MFFLFKNVVQFYIVLALQMQVSFLMRNFFANENILQLKMSGVGQY